MVIKIGKPVVIGSFIGTCFGGVIMLNIFIVRFYNRWSPDLKLWENFGGVKYEEKNLAENKVVIITGANTGIGREMALELAQRKAKVIMACRDIERCEKAREEIVLKTQNKYVYCRTCDLASQSSVRKFAERFKKEHQRLDILINNAGVMRCPLSKTKEGIEMQLGVNHMGHFLLTNLLLDRLKVVTFVKENDKYLIPNSVVHEHNTRQRLDFYRLRHTCNKTENSPFIKEATQLYSLSQYIKKLEEFNIFELIPSMPADELSLRDFINSVVSSIAAGENTESAPSRVVNVSSVAHKRGKIKKDDLNSDKHYDRVEAYNQSKLANVLFTRELAKRLQGTGVTVNAVHPGIVNTEITRHMSIYKSYIALMFIKPIAWVFIKTPKQGAQTAIYASLSPDLEKVTGKYFCECKESEMSSEALDDSTANWLWLVSEKWTRLNTT